MPEYVHNYNGVDMGEGRLGLPKRITASNTDSRAWFARGWLHTLNFYHEEAIDCFKRCIDADSRCIMGWWGIAYAQSSNYNFPAGLGSGYDAINSAAAAIEKSNDTPYTELEQDLIRALTVRSSAETKAAIDPKKMFFGNTPEMNRAFADEMAKLHRKHPGDLDVAFIYADAVMVLRPWAMWTKDDASGELVPSDESTSVIKDVLEAAMQTPGGMQHPGVLHMYCHLMELSPDPVAAMPAADALRTLLPSASHLTHMASHIDIWAGQYKEALDMNLKSVDADKSIVKWTGERSSFTGYRIHNIHMAAWAALFTGQKTTALAMARDMDEELLSDEGKTSGVKRVMFENVPVGHLYFEPYCMVRWHVMIRFGMWDEILAEELQQDHEHFPTSIASGRYARGLAYAAKGMVAEAEREQAEYVKAMKNPRLEGQMLHNNVMMSDERPCILKVGEAMLAGEIEYRKGNFEKAFESLREAVRLDRGLPYDEPWGWMVPAEHALGALLLEQGHVKEATAVFRANLDMYKNNMWGLLGLSQCLERAGNPEAETIKIKFNDVSSTAEVKPTATCFCAQRTGAKPPRTSASLEESNASAQIRCCDES